MTLKNFQARYIYILKDAVSKILLHSFFNWMLRLHNERLNFNFIPVG